MPKTADLHVFQYLVFPCIGLCCSFILHFYLPAPSPTLKVKQFSLDDVRWILQQTDCSVLKKEAKVASDIREYMGSKLNYQFEANVCDETLIGERGRCKAKKVFGLYRHGTRFPTAKHMYKWQDLRASLAAMLEAPVTLQEEEGSSGPLECLKEWKNPIFQMLEASSAEATGLAVQGMKEEFCLGQRLRQRFPGLFSMPYSGLDYDLRSTCKERAIRSALSFSEGLFGSSNVKSVFLKVLDEEEDDLLRYHTFPCPKYDDKVTNNASHSSWYKSFMNSSVFRSVVKEIQHYFNSDYWEVEAGDVATFYQICIHEMSILGRSCWCDLFKPEHLAVLQYNTDIKAFWVKGSGYKITGQRSVNLIKFMLDFFRYSSEQVTLSFAHAETLLPLLSLLDAFPVVGSLTPDNYEEQKSRIFKISRIIPYSGNAQLVLYDCSEGKDAGGLENSHLRLLVNEHPVKMGLCGEVENWAEGLKLCPLEQLRQRASVATEHFADLSDLCRKSEN